MTGLVSVRLIQDWGPRHSDETVEVDEQRGRDLIQYRRALPVGPYHAQDGSVHHVEADCKVGNNIEPESIRFGTGGLEPCAKCSKAVAAPPKDKMVRSARNKGR